MNRLQYLLQFFKDPKVAAVGPTSKRVVDKVCEGLPKDRDIQVLELGPGDGVVTRRLLDHLSSGSRILALETNKRFCDELIGWNDPRLTVVQDQAQHFPQQMKAHSFDGFDRVISGIPCSLLAHEERVELVMEFHRTLIEGGHAVLYQLSPLMKKHLQHFLDLEDMDIKMNGLLPMFVMRGRKKHSKDPVTRDQRPLGSEG